MKLILFVDDEPETLAALRAMLRPRHREWQMEFVESGAAALTELEKQPYDLICSDMRMPSMDGAQLLTTVTERWPGTVRIVLSGYAELTQTLRLVSLAHQYLSKPCDAKQLENTLSRCLNVQDLLNRPALRSLVGQIRQLPALPKTYAKLRDAMSKPNANNTAIAAIVASDTAIAARVLQVVNSAFFRLARQITKIDQAVAYLGFAAVSNLVLS
ncbi:MAG: HDOD domain-containing protein, partial [Candidatus Obscuribacterales bacterium]|nr:HDOD domain-containing protein [Steroidobacteraceae bacterium]